MSQPAVVLEGRLEDSPWVTADAIRRLGAAVVFPVGQKERYASPWLHALSEPTTVKIKVGFAGAVPDPTYEIAFLTPGS